MLPGSDAAALHRREYKFVYRRESFDTLREILSVNARPVQFGESPVSEVRSIYFDDDRLTSCLQSVDGIDPRNKVRIRWYNRHWPAGSITFELKHKRGNYVRKSRTSIKSDAAFEEQPFTEIIASLAAALPEEQAAWLHARANPTMLVSYRREHFLDRDSSIRMTLDYGIQGHDQTGCARPSHGTALPLDDVVVLEVKAPVGCESEVHRLLYPLKPRVVRFSKYAQCCALMGWHGMAASEI